MSFAGWLKRRMLTIRPKDTSFDLLGVKVDPAQRPGLESIVEAFRQGYNLALEVEDLDELAARMTKTFEPQFRGFAHEGVGMALSIQDWFRDRGRVARYLPHTKGVHDFLLALGVGFAMARMPWVPGGIEPYAVARVPLGFDGLVLNGYGFHEGCFKSMGAIDRTPVPKGISAEAARCFDNGLGRALWFMCGASTDRIGATLAKIPPVRHPDLWAGLGTACCYAGRAYPDFEEYERVLARIQELAGEAHRVPLQLGVVLAAMLTKIASNPTRWVDRASEVFLGMPAIEAGTLGETAWREGIAAAPGNPAPYSIYRRVGDRIMEAVANKVRS